MATTKLFTITVTESKAISYIANPDKTDNGRLICTHCCSENPAQASRDLRRSERTVQAKARYSHSTLFRVLHRGKSLPIGL